MRWPDSLDIGVCLSGNRCIKYDTPTNLTRGNLFCRKNIFISLRIVAVLPAISYFVQLNSKAMMERMKVCCNIVL